MFQTTKKETAALGDCFFVFAYSSNISILNLDGALSW